MQTNLDPGTADAKTNIPGFQNLEIIYFEYILLDVLKTYIY